MGHQIDCLGSGPARVLVLHGWTLDSTIWSRATAEIDRDRFTYGFVDFPGYGNAAHVPPAKGITAMAAAALDAADVLGWDTFSVLGHSMGGTTALRLAGLAPSRVERVCALAPVGAAGYPVDGDTYLKFERAWPEIGWIVRFVSPDLSAETIDEIVAQSARTMSRQTWGQYLANWTGADFVSELNGDVPTTLVLGEKDPIATREHLAETLAALHEANVITLPGAAHFPMAERPADAVLAWERCLEGEPAWAR